MLSFLLLAHVLHPVPQSSAEVEAVIDAEQDALFARDCEAVTSFWTEDLTMTVEDQLRASNRDELIVMCEDIMASLPPAGSGPSMRPQILSRTIDMISTDVAYELTIRQSPRGRSSVAKLLVRTNGGWKIKHLHEALAPTPRATRPD
ncbi:YybH family protein [Sphingomicrobium flavum]|uniref:YybH family protein n=1 Tax=Sphingomicrobium flavum TaxID=1229164 RepID=UPI0021ADBE5F|nr:nuclear transport factor 2 family protein [Sphingomicrobium flavum]